MVSCRYPNQFSNSPKTAPHALLRETAYPKAGHAFATHINAQPTAFWRCGGVLRIPPGTNIVHAAFSDRRETLSFKAMGFLAIAGGDYAITRERQPAALSPFTVTPHDSTPGGWVIHDQRDRAAIRQRRPGQPDRLVADAPKEDCVFGCATAAQALAAYLRDNP